MVGGILCPSGTPGAKVLEEKHMTWIPRIAWSPLGPEKVGDVAKRLERWAGARTFWT